MNERPPYKVKILIVDDRADNLLALETLLDPLGHEIIRAQSGQEALKQVLKHDFAVILLDVMMPGMDGFETAELIRQREKSQFIPIIFLTAIAREQQFVFKGYSSGAVDYIYKPLVPEILLAKVKIFIDLFVKSEIMIQQEQELKKLNRQLLNEIAERKKIEKLERIAMIASKSFNAISISDHEGVIEWVNDGFTLLTGYTAEELIGTRAEVVRRDGSAYGEYVDVVKKKLVPVSYEEKHQTKAGKEFFVLVTLTPVLNEKGKLDKIVTIGSDITEHKNIEEKLIEANRVAEGAVKAKQQFLSNMSHEIRTPMNAIIGFTKVALKTDLSPKQREYLNAIKTSGDALIVLINDILDLAKVEAGKMTFEQIPFKLQSSVSAILHLFEPKIYEKNLEFIQEYDPQLPSNVIGDPMRLHQVMMNLVGNAVKFTHDGSIRVITRLASQDQDTATVEFMVSDTGIGISPDRLNGIFENFQQAAPDTARIYGGTGLGLSIVKQLVEKQGGQVTVESEPGKGSEFRVVIPFKKSDVVPDHEPDHEPEQGWSQGRILIVEDMPLNQLLLRTILDGIYQYDTAENGKVAIDKLSESHFDLVLMDLQMPEMNGFEATHHIRHKMPYPINEVPIIALTADVTTSDLKRCRDEGMNDYIAKPINERLLYSKIGKLLQKVTTIPTENT